MQGPPTVVERARARAQTKAATQAKGGPIQATSAANPAQAVTVVMEATAATQGKVERPADARRTWLPSRTFAWIATRHRTSPAPCRWRCRPPRTARRGARSAASACAQKPSGSGPARAQPSTPTLTEMCTKRTGAMTTRLGSPRTGPPSQAGHRRLLRPRPASSTRPIRADHGPDASPRSGSTT
jgi:hypothetical protein